MCVCVGGRGGAPYIKMTGSLLSFQFFARACACWYRHVINYLFHAAEHWMHQVMMFMPALNNYT